MRRSSCRRIRTSGERCTRCTIFRHFAKPWPVAQNTRAHCTTCRSSRAMPTAAPRPPQRLPPLMPLPCCTEADASARLFWQALFSATCLPPLPALALPQHALGGGTGVASASPLGMPARGNLNTCRADTYDACRSLYRLLTGLLANDRQRRMRFLRALVGAAVARKLSRGGILPPGAFKVTAPATASTLLPFSPTNIAHRNRLRAKRGMLARTNLYKGVDLPQTGTAGTPPSPFIHFYRHGRKINGGCQR